MKRKHILFLATTAIIVVPFIAGAAGIAPDCEGPTCKFSDFVKLGQNIMDFTITIGVAGSAAIAAWVGILLATGRGNPSTLTRAKTIGQGVAIGFGIMLGGYLAVNAFTYFFLHKQIKDIFTHATNYSYENV
jgi:hypothetical protein